MNYFELFFAYTFVRHLTTAWKDTEAYKLGVIDENGYLLIPSDKLTQKQKSSFTVFHKLVWNIKRLIEKIPGGDSKLASFSASLFLLKEPPMSPKAKKGQP